MKKLVVIYLVFAMFLSGCYSVRVLSDGNTNITLASRYENLPYKESYKVWYILWGLIPISDNTTNKLLSNSKLKKIRVNSKMRIDDFLVSFILGGTISVVSWTVEIEGAE